MSRTNYEDTSVAAQGVEVFAGIMLIVGGVFQVIQSIAAIARDEYIVVLPDYVFSVDLTVWGWIHLLVGLILAAVGVFLLLGKGFARIAGIVVAGISAVVNFSWLPYSPLWAMLLIAVDILVIWALATRRRDYAS
ncbi:MAG TPA: hypothetical protein VLJ88_00385 [Propionibacteriaceae bacterium]|nr:hypothetical protein [Propionibacteriaceae bacterium]